MASETLEIVIAARDQFTGTANRVVGSLNRMNTAAGRVGRGMGQMAGGLARVGAVAAGAAAAGILASAKAASDYEQAFSGVRKTLNATPAELAKISAQFRRMATEMPVAATEFARIGEAAGALGIKTDQVAEFSRVVALLGVTTNLSADQAAEAFGVLGNILGLTNDQFSRAASALVALGNNGASTEAQIVEITKRFAAAGKQAGLSTSQIFGYSSAIASVGVEVESAGSSLSRLFNNATLAIGTNSKKLKGYVAVAGEGFVKLYKKDANAAIELFLRNLAKLDKFQAAAALKKAGIVNVRDINAILLLSQNLGLLKDQLKTSKEGFAANTALSKEAGVRFQTLASQVMVLKNNLIEAGIGIGEGMLPALKRATERLTAFIKNNQGDLRAFGAELGQALEKVNWDALLAGAKSFVGLLKTAFGVLNSLPTEIKAAGAAFLGLNKLSGGLLGAGAGNIIGGLASAGTRGLAAKVPGVGSLFAQPVFVTNWPMGGIGGGVGGGGGRGGIGDWMRMLGIIGIGAELQFVATQEQVQGASSVAARTVADAIATQTTEQLEASRKRVESFINSPLGKIGGAAASIFGGSDGQAELAAIIAELERRSSVGRSPDATDRAAAGEAARELREVGYQSQRAGERMGGFSGALAAASVRARDLFAASRAIRAGSGLKSGNFLAREWRQGTLDKKDVTVANAMTLALTQHSPTAQNLSSMKYELTNLTRIQRAFAAQGDRKSAAAIGRDIAALKKAIKDQQIKIKVEADRKAGEKRDREKMAPGGISPAAAQQTLDLLNHARGERGQSPIVNIKVNVSVTERAVRTSSTKQIRYGPSTGSAGRHTSSALNSLSGGA